MSENKPILFGPLPPPMGGVAVFMSYMARQAARLGVTVWSYKGTSAGDDSVRVLHVNHRRLEHLFALLREGYKARIIDSTHFHLEHPNWLLLPLWLAAKFFLRFTWVKILHDGTLPPRLENFGFLQRMLFRAAISHIDEFVLYDRNLKDWLCGKIAPERECHFIPILLPLPSDWQSQTVDEKLTPELAEFAAHEKRICSIGIFEPNYGFHHVADAIEKLRAETGKDIGLLLIDGLFARDESFRAAILKDRDWIKTIENVPHQRLPGIFRHSHAFVRAVEFESYGLSKVEALLCNVPVIATNAGETRGMFLYKYGDKATLAEHLKKVLSDDFVSETEKWAQIYRAEAEQNLESYLRLIMGDSQLAKGAAD